MLYLGKLREGIEEIEEKRRVRMMKYST